MQGEVGPLGFLPPGSSAPALLDYRAVREDEVSVSKGEIVHIVSSNLSRGYLVRTGGGEGWLPSYCLHSANQEPKKHSSWGFRVRKQSFTRDKSSRDSCSIVHVLVGQRGVLKVRSKRGDKEAPTWRTVAGTVLTSGGRLSLESLPGVYQLVIDQCELSDSGEYHCVFSGNETYKILLQVSKVSAPPTQPRVQDLKGTSAVITWERSEGADERALRLEWCRLAGGQWQTVKENLQDGLCIVDNLVPGETYSFRLLSYSLDGSSPDSDPSLPSPPLTVPLGDGAGSSLLSIQRKVDHDPTLQTNFEQQYIELEEVNTSVYYLTCSNPPNLMFSDRFEPELPH